MKKKLIMGACILLGLCLAKQPVYAAVDQETTQTKTVELDKKVPLASAAKYKKDKYDFLADFSYGSTLDANKKVSTTEKLLNSEDSSLSAGMKIQTKGFYKEGDGGSGVYLLSEKAATGALKMKNGLYANLRPDCYVDANGIRWALVSVKQLGAKADGQKEDQDAINNAVKLADTVANGNEDYDRGLIYLPEGEYKCGNMLHVGVSHCNLVGAGEKTIIFTDNDYRDEEGYSEFFFEVWGGVDTYIADFQIEAREVDLYHYMRQFVFVYSKDVYVYNVATIVPQEAYSSYYYEDKQYSNYCCYCGNKNITIDGCKMVQMSGTYRGANLGVLDIWAAGEENITIMNCDMYGNARDEQVGFFSKSDPNAFVKHVQFVNNTMHSTQIKYPEIIGNRTMCFTVAYNNSQNIDDIRIAGNHFICETDSKFMTFGKLTNCIVEDNMIEIKCTYATWSMIFDSGNGDPKNILVRNNEFYVTSDEGKGKGNVVGGNLTLQGNRIFSDVVMPFGINAPEIHNNKIIFLENMGILTANGQCSGNEIYLYNGLGSVGTNRMQIAVYGGTSDGEYKFANNKVYDYLRYNKMGIYRSLIKLDGDLKSLKLTGNEFMFPNARYCSDEHSAAVAYEDKLGKYYKNNIYRKRSGTYKSVLTEGNVFQMVNIPESDSVFTYKNNVEKEGTANLEEELTTKVKLMYQGKEVTKITTDLDKIDLDDVEYVAQERTEKGEVVSEKVVSGKKVKWYSSLENMASVTKDGVVKRNLYGEVHIYAVPLDGSGVYGECEVHFTKKKATSIQVKEKTVHLQKGLKYYVEYKVLPDAATQDLTWTSKDTSVATVNYNGMIQGVAAGTTTVVGATTDGSGTKVSIQVIVDPLTVKKIKLNKAFLHFEQNQIGVKEKLEVSGYTPADADNLGIGKWESDDTKVAVVDQDGVVTVSGGGLATIYAYSKDLGCKAACTVYVQPSKLEQLEASNITDTSAVLTWQGDQEAYGYYIYQWDDGTSKWKMLNNDKYVTDTKFSVGGLSKNKQYKFCVRAFISNWQTGERIVYESPDAVVQFKTLDYVPITNLWSSTEHISVAQGSNQTMNVTYSNKNADVSKVSLRIADESKAEIVDLKQEAGKFSFGIKGLSYGATTLTVAANDSIGLSKEIPIRVVAKKMVKGDSMKVEGRKEGASICFDAIENEKEEQAAGGMNGYAILRTQSMNFSTIDFVPAQGKESYSYLDKTAKGGQSYQYAVAAAYKTEDHIYCSYSNGKYPATIPISIFVNQITPTKKLYSVVEGSKIVISALVGPEDATTQRLEWTSSQESIAKVKRCDYDFAELNMQYGLVEGVAPGTVEITVTPADGSKVQTTITVKVVAKSEAEKEAESTPTLVDETALIGKVYTVENCQYKITGTSTARLVKVVNKSCELLVVPNKIAIGTQTFSVTAIEGKAAVACKKIKSVVIGSQVKTIGNSAFAGLTKLKTLHCNSKKLTTIGAKAFYGCKMLTNVKFVSSKINLVGKKAWANTTKKLQIKVPKKQRKKYGKLFKKAGCKGKVAF